MHSFLKKTLSLSLALSLLAGAAGGLLAPALDLGAAPALCALLAAVLTALPAAPALQ